MNKYIYDESNGLWYELQRDYYIPCLTLPAEKEKLREEKQGVTAQITELRRRLKYAAAIEKRSAHIDDCLNQIHDTLENQRSNPSTRTGSTDRRREELQR